MAPFGLIPPADHWTGLVAATHLVKLLLACAAAPRWQLDEVQELLRDAERHAKRTKPWLPEPLSVRDHVKQAKQIVAEAVARSAPGQQLFPAVLGLNTTASEEHITKLKSQLCSCCGRDVYQLKRCAGCRSVGYCR